MTVNARYEYAMGHLLLDRGLFSRGEAALFRLAQKVMEHGSATVAFADYCCVLSTTQGGVAPSLPDHAISGPRL